MAYYDYTRFLEPAQILEPLPAQGNGLLQRVLALTDYEPLLERLRLYNHTGRPPYPVEAMWRVIVCKYLLNLRYNTDLIDTLRSNSRLRELCGLGDRVPSPSMLTRFFKRLALHEELVHQAFIEIATTVSRLLDNRSKLDDPGAGSILAIDSTDVASFANGNRDPATDPDAKWGHKSSHKTKDGNKVDWVFGYKVHLICDATYGIPLSYTILPANASDSRQLPRLVKQVKAAHPWLDIECLLADKGYDGLPNYQFLDDQGIDPIILIRDVYKHGDLYDAKGRPICTGNVPMEYVETDDEGQHHFRCNPEGCHLKWKLAFSLYCQDTSEELPEGDLLRRLGRTARASTEFKDLYNLRQTIERFFRSAKHSRLLNQHQYRGMAKIRLHVALSVLAYVATMHDHVRCGRLDKIRQMRVDLPKDARAA